MIREARRQLETVGTMVERTPPQVAEASDRPDIDARIHAALDARLGSVSADGPDGYVHHDDVAPSEPDSAMRYRPGADAMIIAPQWWYDLLARQRERADRRAGERIYRRWRARQRAAKRRYGVP